MLFINFSEIFELISYDNYQNIYKLKVTKNNMKKEVLVFFTLISFIFLIGLVSAAPYGGGFSSVGDKARMAMDNGAAALAPIASYILGDADTGGLLFAKVLFFIIILSIVWLALNNIELFSDYIIAHWAITIVVSILAVRFLGDQNWMNTILLPYGTLGIAISAGLPFVIFAMVVHWGFPGPQNRTIRRIAWLFFAVIFIGLWISREDLGESAWIYPVTAIASVVMLFMDGTIQNFFYRMQLDRYSAKDPARQMVLEQMARNDDLLAKGMISNAEHAKMKKKLSKRLLELNKS